MSNKLFVESVADAISFPARIAAKFSKAQLEVAVANDDSKKQNPAGTYPCLVTAQGNLNESVAIAKFLAHGHSILGHNAEERARVDQWIYWSLTGALPQQARAVGAVLGQVEVTQAEYTESMNAVKANAKILNGALKNKQWLAADFVTLADIVVASHFITAQQTILDGGFRKAMPDYSNWFERVVALPEFVAVCGHVKSCSKAIKPQIKQEEKKKEEKKQQPAAKKQADDDDDQPKKKPKSALETLPPTNFDLFNFKTFFVNEPDRYGSAVDEFLKMYDKDGWSCWFLHYEMYGNEGKLLYHTENLCDGFLQRFDDFRKWSFGRMCILGTDDKQEIMGAFMWRSTGIPQECHDHPQFEYYKTRQLDILNNKDDLKILREFWGSKENDIVQGLPVITPKWHK